MKDLKHHRRSVQKKVLKAAKKEKELEAPPVRPRKDKSPKLLKSKPISKRNK